MSSRGDEIRVSAPGRVNLIGDHTDYTGGLVMPMVIDRQTTITGVRRDQALWTITSADEPEAASLSLPIADPASVRPLWARYVAGVLAGLQEHGVEIPGFSGEIRTTIPIGSGLSSSAALEVAVARVVLQDSSHPLADDQVEVARLCQQAEQSAVGVPCGIMDQLSIVAGRPGSATLIDCHDLSIDLVEIPDAVRFDVQFVHTRALAESAYAERVAQCTAVEEVIGPLRSARVDDLAGLPSDLLRRRARHVITENERVRAFAAALRAQDFVSAGDLMTAGHRSLARDYECSTPDMDGAVAAALREPGVFGARMTGGGFGGCIVIMRSN